MDAQTILDAKLSEADARTIIDQIISATGHGAFISEATASELANFLSHLSVTGSVQRVADPNTQLYITASANQLNPNTGRLATPYTVGTANADARYIIIRKAVGDTSEKLVTIRNSGSTEVRAAFYTTHDFVDVNNRYFIHGIGTNDYALTRLYEDEIIEIFTLTNSTMFAFDDGVTMPGLLNEIVYIYRRQTVPAGTQLTPPTGGTVTDGILTALPDGWSRDVPDGTDTLQSSIVTTYRNSNTAYYSNPIPTDLRFVNDALLAEVAENTAKQGVTDEIISELITADRRDLTRPVVNVTGISQNTISQLTIPDAQLELINAGVSASVEITLPNPFTFTTITPPVPFEFVVVSGANYNINNVISATTTLTQDDLTAGGRELVLQLDSDLIMGLATDLTAISVIMLVDGAASFTFQISDGELVTDTMTRQQISELFNNRFNDDNVAALLHQIDKNIPLLNVFLDVPPGDVNTLPLATYSTSTTETSIIASEANAAIEVSLPPTFVFTSFASGSTIEILVTVTAMPSGEERHAGTTGAISSILLQQGGGTVSNSFRFSGLAADNSYQIRIQLRASVPSEARQHLTFTFHQATARLVDYGVTARGVQRIADTETHEIVDPLLQDIESDITSLENTVVSNEQVTSKIDTNNAGLIRYTFPLPPAENTIGGDAQGYTAAGTGNEPTIIADYISWSAATLGSNFYSVILAGIATVNLTITAQGAQGDSTRIRARVLTSYTNEANEAMDVEISPRIPEMVEAPVVDGETRTWTFSLPLSYTGDELVDTEPVRIELELAGISPVDATITLTGTADIVTAGLLDQGIEAIADEHGHPLFSDNLLPNTVGSPVTSADTLPADRSLPGLTSGIASGEIIGVAITYDTLNSFQRTLFFQNVRVITDAESLEEDAGNVFGASGVIGFALLDTDVIRFATVQDGVRINDIRFMLKPGAEDGSNILSPPASWARIGNIDPVPASKLTLAANWQTITVNNGQFIIPDTAIPIQEVYVEAMVTETTAQRPYAVGDRVGITIPLPIFGRRYIKSLRAAAFVVRITAARVVEITENDSGSAIAIERVLYR